FFFFFQAEDGIRDRTVTGVQTCGLPICRLWPGREAAGAKDGGPAFASGCAAGTAGRGRCSGHRHLPSAYCRHAKPASRRCALNAMRERTAILFSTVLIAVLAVCAQQAPSAAEQENAQAITPKITFTFNWTSANPQFFKLEVDSTGRAAYNSQSSKDDSQP